MTLASPQFALDPSLRDDRAVFWRIPRHGGLDCLHAVFRHYRYVPHTHETYAVATITAGCEAFFHRGARRYAGPGDIAIVGPDELHDGEPHGEAFVYRTCYPSIELVCAIAGEVLGRPVTAPPRFPSVVHDPELAASLASLNLRLCSDAGAGPLEQDQHLVQALGLLVARWSDAGVPRALAADSGGVARARAHLDAHYAEVVGLDDLAAVADLSRAHLIRAFRARTGLTPHAYQVDRRFREACRLLEAGEAPGGVAAACGFFDQSHLNRVFKARMGVTPGAYRAA